MMSNSRITITPYYFGRRSRVVVMCFCATIVLALVTRWRYTISPPYLWTVLPPATERQLAHLRRSRYLPDYVDGKKSLLIAPQSGYCAGLEDVEVVALVSSSPGNAEQRAAIRATWGGALATYFFMGRTGSGDLDANEDMISNYIEAKQHGDMIVGDFVDSYENLTLKTAHMMQWASRSCPHARFLLKTDDDVLVNPWTLTAVLRDNYGRHLVGYKVNGSAPHRDVENKWYLPKWLYRDDVIPEYLSGTAYLVNGEHLDDLISASNRVPLINLEDVYLTYLVARKSLKLTLSHDSRLSPFQPMVSHGCAFFKMASAHGLTAKQILDVWPKLRALAERYKEGKDPCYLFDKIFRVFERPMRF